ncbi:MAG: hypothetical protein HY323_15240 [Betaproteobacteria bacterium]|nr:hypothetical protein [Betaproteobacteria bacterium]MBI3938332.1 hypothetical protein [Betaproteobacteria bacterium]
MLGALKLAIISEGVNSWPFYVAQSKSLFAREGIEADITLTGSSARQLDAEGFMSLGSTAEYFPTYPGPIAAARRSWAREHGHELLSFIRAMRAAHGWLTDRRNRNEAVQVLCARLDTDPVQAAAAFDAFAERPQPQITAAGLRQVIETVWEAEGFRRPRRAPENYMDLSYLARAEKFG